MAQGIPSYDTDSDDELPHGWEERSTQEGFVFYANHLLKKTQWENPKTQRRKRVSSELPYGWERNVDEQERVFYVDHINKRTTYTDPRLAFAFDLEEDNIARDVRQRFDGSTYADEILEGRDLSGKVAIVTGANSGIGYETARALAHHGAKVVLACRNLEKGQAAADRIQLNRKDVNVLVMELDLASLRSIRKFAHDFLSSSLPLNYLILNAGVFALPWALTEDKIERTFATNHVGHFYLTKLLTDMLIKSAPARVVVVSSESHRFDSKSCELNLQDLNPLQHQFWAYQQYNRSKLCNVLFSNELNRKLRSHGVSCNSLHPGNMMYTSLCESTWYYKLIFFLARPFTKTMKQGAACSVFVATARELEGVGGLYFNNCYRCEPSDMAKDRKLATKLWKMTEELIEDRLRLIPGT